MANKATYYPPSEAEGGWRYLINPAEIQDIAGMDPKKLDIAQQMQEFLYAGDSWSIVIIRNGYIVKEYHTINVLPSTRFDVWSVTKSFTATAWGCLLEDSRKNMLPNKKNVDLGSYAYQYIPNGYPLSDTRKEHINIKHLLTMSSGIPGQKQGIIGTSTNIDNGPFEYALGRCPNRFGKWVDKLFMEPGAYWDYSDPAFIHLSMIFKEIMKREISDYFKDRVLDPIGIKNLSWDITGGGGFIGPHTNAISGIHISARELARFGYLFLKDGIWKDKEIIPKWWIELCKKPSQDLNPSFSYSWIINTESTSWPELPRDAFAVNPGYRSNKCYIIPSLDLVVTRVGSGPSVWDEDILINDIADSIL
jgi:CubicO group peptidase (beta-lactamase class C family)